MSGPFLTDPERDWPIGDYHHGKCADCGHPFGGPKREIYCYVCVQPREAKAEAEREARRPVVLTMPAPPSVNTCFRNVTGKGRVRTQRYNTWARAAGNEVMAQMPRHTPGEVLLDITIKRRRKTQDLDNMLKPILDLLVNMAVMDDDKNVGEIRCRWGDVPGAVVEISPLSK